MKHCATLLTVSSDLSGMAVDPALLDYIHHLPACRVLLAFTSLCFRFIQATFSAIMVSGHLSLCRQNFHTVTESPCSPMVFPQISLCASLVCGSPQTQEVLMIFDTVKPRILHEYKELLLKQLTPHRT